ncbi:MAG: class I SAM-dependent methyltransferase [Promethearchaeota archaeon]|nr:MAG: class I SAM-dependent methyltransferase [Candidatus Lokiarchaeota archaeon]
MKINRHYYINCQLDLPFLETDNAHVIEIFKTLHTKFGLRKNSNQKLVDLGAGSGRIIIFAAINYGIKSFGIEIDQNLIHEIKEFINFLKREKKCQHKIVRKIIIKLGDFYSVKLSKFDYIYMYSLPTMHQYLNHVLQTAKKGAVVISYKYPIHNYEDLLKLEEMLLHGDENKNTCFTFFYSKI